MSEPVKPIQYWVDSGAPEDVKKALVEGASWWNQAFEAAGFRNAFKVDVLPDGADPMDIRYNMINWVHRSTRGWSSGGIGLRSAHRRDHQGDGHARVAARSAGLHDLRGPALALRQRQREAGRSSTRRRWRASASSSAHEVGHTLGLGHNYYDSTKGWISVMDYPHPLEELKADGTIDLSKAYQARIGDWDKVAINYGYREFPTGTDEAAALHEDPRRRVGAGPALLHQPGHRHPPARRAVVERRQPGRRAEPADEGAPRRARSHRRAHDPARRADGDDRRAARADLHVSPLRGRRRGVDDRRPGLRLRACAATAARRRSGSRRRISARRSTRWRRRSSRRSSTVPKTILDLIPPRPPGFGMHRELFPRTTGEGFDPLSPGDDRRRRDHRLRAAARSRGAHGGAARRRSDAARPRRSDRSADQGDLRRADGDAVRSGGAARRRARAGRSRDVAGDGVAQRPGAGDRVAQAAAAGRAPATPAAAKTEADQAQHTLLAADIKRFLERPAPNRRRSCRRRRRRRARRSATPARTGWRVRRGARGTIDLSG